MKLLNLCSKCVHESGKPSSVGEIVLTEIRDDNRYELICPKGHKTVTLLQQLRFELLFDMGAHAILDGHYRDAVFSFTSSLERFYEYAIRVLLEKASGSDELFQNCWKSVSNYSERQLGAFIFLWATNFNDSPKLLEDRQAKFRNDVVHKGKIPDKDEAIKYGDNILSIICPKLVALQDKMRNEINNVVFYHLRDGRTISDKEIAVATMCVPTILRVIDDNRSHYSKTLEQHLSEMKSRRRVFGDAL